MKKELDVWFYDVEIFGCFFCVSFKNKEKLIIFEISERKNDYLELYDFYQFLKGKYLVGFNSVNYDNLIMSHAIELINNDVIDYQVFCKKLKHFSDIIIYGHTITQIKIIQSALVTKSKEEQLKLRFELEELEVEKKTFKFNFTEEQWYARIKDYRFAHKWIDIDLFLYWSKGLRMTKQLSLKSIATQLKYHTIQELPIPHNAVVQLEDIPKIITYNSIHDIGITELLYNHMLEDVTLRKTICDDYGLKAMSWDAPKIASEILLQSYCKKRFGKTDWETMKKVRDKKHKKEDFLFKDVLPKVSFKTKLFKDMYNTCLNSENTFSYSMIVPFEIPLKLDYGIGGLHNSFSNQIFEKGTYDIITSDIAAMYPQNLINMKAFRYFEVLAQYEDIKKERITIIKPTLKKYKKEENKEQIAIWKIKDTFVKLLLNGVSGLLDSPFNWLFNNTKINGVRVYGQLILSRLIEECYILGFNVISANTDGVEVLLKKDTETLYFEIIKNIETEFNVEFESEKYKAIYYSNVNNYLAITENGIKRKGSNFITQPLIGNSNDFMAVPKLINLYLIDGIKPEDVLTKDNWKKHLEPLDFCASYKIAKKYTVYWNNEKQQQLNRFYVSKTGKFLYKQKQGKNLENVLKGFGVELLNNYDKNQTEYNFDFNFYLKKINDILYNLQIDKIQTSLF